MVVHVSEIEPSEHDVVFQTLRRAAKDQATLFFVVCVDDGQTSEDRSSTIAGIVDEARRHVNAKHSSREHLSVADLHMDRNRYEVSRAGRPIHLSPMEYSLLEFLMLHQNRAVTEDVLMRSVFRGAAKNGRCNTLWVHIHRLRRKVDQHAAVPLIHTIKGVGYILKSPSLSIAAQA